MPRLRSHRQFANLARISAMLLLVLGAAAANAAALSTQSHARLAAGQTVQVIVTYEVSQTDAAAAAERSSRHLQRDDAAIKALRAQGYAATKAAVAATVRGDDA